MHVVVVPPRLKGSREHVVESVSDSGAGQLVALSGVRDRGASAELVGHTLLCPASELPEGFDAHDVPSLLGRCVCDARLGTIGTIEEVMVGPANDVWVVRGPRGEVLVPVVDAYVDPVGPSGTITTHLPGGLVGQDGEEGGGES